MYKRFEIRVKNEHRLEPMLHGLTTLFARWAILTVICILSAQQVYAQHATGVTIMVSVAQPACSEAAVDVEAASSDERRLVCSSARRAIERLARCGIVLQRSVSIQILAEVRHPRHGGMIFGFFDITQEVVLVTKYDNIPDLVRDTPYGELRPLNFYKSVIVHEVVHAVMHQNLKRIPTTHASYEYPAYAIQFESLSANERDKLLRATESESKSDNFIFNDLILFFDPFFFAAQAYQHFKAAPNSCAHLHALLEGEAPFIGPALLL